jgi:hypothetical protein
LIKKWQKKSKIEKFLEAGALESKLRELHKLAQQQKEHVSKVKAEKQTKNSTTFILDDSGMIKPIKYDSKNSLSYFVENLPPIAGTGEAEKTTKVIQEILFAVGNQLVDSSDSLIDNLISTIKGKSFKGADFSCQLKFESILRAEKQQRTHCVAVLISLKDDLLTSLAKIFPSLLVGQVASKLNRVLRNKRFIIRTHFEQEEVKKSDLFRERVTNWKNFQFEFEKSIAGALKSLPALMKKWKQEFEKL